MSTVVSASPPLSRQLRIVAADIKLAHSVFALPFALLAAFLARDSGQPWSRFAGQLILIVVCMVLARTWAMLFNRIVDRRFDAENPRTKRRALAAGAMSPRQAWGVALGAAGLFVLAAAAFWPMFGNAWPALLSVPVLAWIAFYSLTKRFTVLCHVFLGGALAASPVAAAIAINPESLANPALWWIAGMVLVWVAGFDIIYALQDIDFDRGAGLRSVPARLGASRALWVSRALHAAAPVFLVMAWRAEPGLSTLFAAGIGAVVVLLVLEHAILIIRGSAGLNMAFFTVNGIVSCILGAAGIADLLL